MAQGTPNFAITPQVGAGIVSIGDVSRTAPSNAVTILTGAAAGTRVERVVVSGLGPTTLSAFRIWLNDGSTYHLYYEGAVQSSSAAPSQGTTVWQATLEAVTTPNMFPLLVPNGWTLQASVNDTQIGQELLFNGISLAQTTSGAVNLLLNGSLVTAGANAGFAALVAPTANVPFTLTATTPPYPAQVTITSASNLSGVSYVITGRDATGVIQTETLVGPNANTVYSAKVYAAVLQVVPTGTNVAKASLGYSTVAPVSAGGGVSPIILASGANLSAINFTIFGTNFKGVVQTETLAGPNSGYVSSASSYQSITSIKSSTTVASNVTVGTPAIVSGLKVVAIGGSF